MTTNDSLRARPTMTIYAKPTRDEVTRWAGYALRNSSIDYIDEELIEDFADGLCAFEAPTPPAPQETAGEVVAVNALVWAGEEDDYADVPNLGLRYLLMDPSSADECNGWYVLEERTNTVIEADGSREAAYAAAQSDFDRRILPFIITHPTPAAAPTDNTALVGHYRDRLNEMKLSRRGWIDTALEAREALKVAGDYLAACQANGLPDLGEASRMPFIADVIKQVDAALSQPAAPQPTPEVEAWNGPGEKRHTYSPDYQAMGDCRICGHDWEAHQPAALARGSVAAARIEGEDPRPCAPNCVDPWEGSDAFKG